MTLTQTIMISLISAAIVVGVTIFLAGRVHAHAPPGVAAMSSGHYHGHAWHPRRGQGYARWCAEDGGRHAQRWLERVEARLALDASQAAAWQELTAQLHAGVQRLRNSCDAFDADAIHGAAPEKLAQAELLLSAGLETVQQLRPSMERFYAVLDSVQRQTLNEMLARRHHRGR